MTERALSRRSLLGLGAAGAAFGAAPALASDATPRRSRVDRDGVWRWADGREVALFGVNYNIASASAFRFADASGVPFERIVAQDFAHFQRLGFNALRLSFWGDWEATTADGTLVANRHLDVLDLVIAHADEIGMSCLLSPIVTYDASWPDALDAPRAGLSHAFAKDVLGTDAAAIAAQARYLGQLLSRTNPLTGRRYADEPAIVAVEPINEPTHHAADRAGSIRYIDALAAAVRGAGFTGPIFYNVTQDMAIAPAIAAARVDGATFAWYPTGLQNGLAVPGNGLLLVDNYRQFDDPALGARAKLVYEFDAADSMATYFYPAMVRAFRGGGAQFAAMFAYDAMTIAAANSEFNDHFLNLAYTPGKAISALIGACAMRELPRGERFGVYPASRHFGAFHVDDRMDLSELADATRFFHSNMTATRPPAPARLEHLAGCGSSPLVEYDGTGAWFLDRVAAGVWRLEVHPDAALVANPFVFRRPSRPAVRIVHRQRRLRLRLPDLGEAFRVARADGTPVDRASDGSVLVTPGVYRLSRGASGIAVDRTFFAPPGEMFAPIVQHVPPRSLTAGQPWTVAVAVVSPEPPREVTLRPRTDRHPLAVPLIAGRGFDYRGEVPGDAIREGYLAYDIVVETAAGKQVSPPADATLPGDWDFAKTGGYRVAVLAPDSPLTLFDAVLDGDAVVLPYGGYEKAAGAAVVPGRDGRAVLRLDGAALRAPDHDLPAQRAWNGPLDAEGRALDRFAAVTVTGRSIGPDAGRATVILIERDGMAWGVTVALSSSGGDARVPLASLRPVRAAMLPRDFPKGINPYWLRVPPRRGGAGDRLRLADLQAVQVALGTRFLGDERPAVEIDRIALSR